MTYNYDRTVPDDWESAKAKSLELEAHYNQASRALKALSGGGPFNLTPEHVRATPEWQTAKREADRAFQVLRAFNSIYVTKFKQELKQERARRGR